ncbi:hypothetical protein Tco_1129917 [Tanacetum coccineum]
MNSSSIRGPEITHRADSKRRGTNVILIISTLSHILGTLRIRVPDGMKWSRQTMRMVGANGGNQFRQYAGQNVGYQNGYNAVQNVGNQVVQDAVQNQGVQNVGNHNGQIVVPGIPNQNPNGNGNVVAARAEVRPRRRDAAYLQTQLLIAQKEEAGIHLQAEEFDLMAAAADLDEIEEVNANCILMANLQQASTSGYQLTKLSSY